MEVKRINEMTNEEWEYWTEHSDIANLLQDAEEEVMEEIDLSDLERPDYSKYDSYLAQPLWSEIIEGLWQGGTDDNDVHHQLKKPFITTKQFDTVVTMYADANPVDWHVKEIRYGVWDSVMSDFDPEELFDIVRIAHSDWKKGKKVLIRCQAGWNRSGLITALVLMREGMSARDAIDLIRRKRSSYALCNRQFEKFLLAQDPKAWRGNTLKN